MRSFNTQQLNVDTRLRLAKLLGMMGSDHDGEALNAARMADRLVHESGVTWFDVVATPMLPEPKWSWWTDDETLADFADCRAACRFCLRRRDLLTRWEQEFLPDIMRFLSLSEKQVAVLRKLVLRVMAAGEVP
jgi:hypothetical protein